MLMDDKKPSASTTTTPPPSSTPPPASTPASAVRIKNPLISRRRFLQGAVAASVVLAAASVGASGQILGPLIPSSSTSEEIIDWTTLDNRYKDVKGKVGEFQLQCPCHGSQYRLVDGVPVAGPAYDLGLNPLPEVQLSVDANGKISAVGTLIGEPGIGRTQ